MHRFIVFLSTMFAIGAFVAVFAIVFPQIPKERAVFVHNEAEAENAVAKGQRLTIGLKSPAPFIAIVGEVKDDGFTTSDGRTFLFQDLFAIVKGRSPANRGYDWRMSQPLSDLKKALSLDQTVTVILKGPEPITGMITEKDSNYFKTEDGKIIAYSDVAFVASHVPLVERIGRTAISVPFFLLWACVDFASIFGFH